MTGKPRENIAKAFSTSLDEAVRFREDAKKSGKTFVLTNGCFDLLHYGHVSSLTEASKLGDYLWVDFGTAIASCTIYFYWESFAFVYFTATSKLMNSNYLFVFQ